MKPVRELLFLADTELSDIREIVSVPNYWPWLLTAAVLGALAALVAWLLARRNRRSGPVESVEAPAEKALRRLAALRERDSAYDAEPFTVEVSAIVRTYLEEALDLPAPEQTSEEFLQNLRDQPWLTPRLQQDLEEFLQLADLVKFARQSLDPGQRVRLLDGAVQLVEATRPQPEPQPIAR